MAGSNCIRAKARSTRPATCIVCGVGFGSYNSGGIRTQCCTAQCARISRRLKDGSHPTLARIVVVTKHSHCATCGKHYQFKHSQAYCSPECRPSANAWKPTHLRCVTCGVEIESTKWQRNCADCKAQAERKERRVARSRRRARVRNLPHDAIDPIAVFARDKWQCQLCGIKTPMRLRGTYEPNAPELDHIIPLALDGPHTWENVQCTCRQCNQAKGATPMGQLGLKLAA